jgi:hypothetical protein
LNLKLVRPSYKAAPCSSASQEVNHALASKGYRIHALGSQKSQQVITKETGEITTGLGSEKFSKATTSSQDKGKEYMLKGSIVGGNSKEGKVESTLFDSYGNSSSQVPMT